MLLVGFGGLTQCPAVPHHPALEEGTMEELPRPLRAEVLRAVPKRASQGALCPVQPRLPLPSGGHPGGAGGAGDNSPQAFLELVGGAAREGRGC